MRRRASARPAAHRLGEEGARVVVGDVNLDGAEATAAAIRAGDGEAIAVHYDQGDAESVAGLVTQVVDRHGRLDGLLATLLFTSRGGPRDLSVYPLGVKSRIRYLSLLL